MLIDEEQPSNNAPHTNPHAKPNKWELAPIGRKVIEVSNAHYRKAVISGRFLIANSTDPYGINKDGHKTIEVECHWYGWKPKTRWMNLTLTNQETEISNDSNVEVIKNIGD